MSAEEHRRLFDLTGRCAVVTGAGRGIGFSLAEGLAAFGASVVIAELDPVTAESAAARLGAQGLNAIGVACDITDTPQFRGLLDRAEAEFGAVDILVNNAGVSARIAAEEYPDDNYHRMVALNQTAVFFGMRDLAKRWIDAGRGGSIINLASFAGLVADPMSVPYAMTKGAVVQLTRTAAVEWADKGIRVNAIAPGYVRTEMTAHTLDTPAAGAVIQAKTALGRAGRTDEMIGAVVFLASDASAYVTGTIVPVDGGWTAM